MAFIQNVCCFNSKDIGSNEAICFEAMANTGTKAVEHP